MTYIVTFKKLLRHFNSACNFVNEIHHIDVLVNELLKDVSLLEISQTELEQAQRKRKNRLAGETFEEK